MEPVRVKDNIYWVGAVDWNVRNFHGYSTHQGTTYNAFLVLDEKVTLFDTVKSGFRDEMVHKIRQIIDPEQIDYIVVDHVELDHSGSLPEIVSVVKPEKIFCSPNGKDALLHHFHQDSWPYEVVRTGDRISLGKRTVEFLETRMVHWPDSMFSFIPEDKLLISHDGFGQHWATGERFDDEVDSSELFKQAAKYYANILLPYSPRITAVFQEVRERNWVFDTIATDHGLIWRRDVDKILQSYVKWSKQEATAKALVVYDTMWHSTERMANALLDGLMSEGMSVRLFDLRANSRDDIMTEVLDAKAIALGSSTINNGVLPLMADMLSYMKGLKPVGKIGAAFGSYGWSGEAVKLLNQVMEEMKFEVPDPGIRVKYVPTAADLANCVELGRKIGKAVNDRL